MWKQFCDTCGKEMDDLEENTGDRDFDIKISARSERRGAKGTMEGNCCCVKCALAWIVKHVKV
jgi:hypothetical protein